MSDLGLQRGTVALRSSGPITFGPDGVLFLADNATATVFAIDVADAGRVTAREPFDLEHVDEHVASYLGAAVDDVAIRDLAVHPAPTTCTCRCSVATATTRRRCSYASIASTAR